MSECSIEKASRAAWPCKAMIAGIATCPECGSMMCPICHRHKVTQLSRVTGYIQDVSGWNAAKRQELFDRKRYPIR